MPSPLFPDDGLIAGLKAFVTGDGGGGGLQFNIFTNNIIPTLSDTLGIYTVPSGIVPWQQVAPTSYAFSSLVAHIGLVSAPDLSFDLSTLPVGFTYGFLVANPAKLRLIRVQLFPAPIVTPNLTPIRVTPLFTSQSFLTQ